MLVTTWLANIAFHLQLIWLQTWLHLIQNHAWHHFQAFALHHLKLLRCSIQIWADTDALLAFPQTGCWFRPAALHRIGFGTCCRQQLLADSNNILFHMEKKKWLVAAQNLQSIKTLLTLELSQYHKSGVFLKRAGHCPQWLQLTQKLPVFVLGCQTSTSRAGELPQKARELPEEPKNQWPLAVDFNFSEAHAQHCSLRLF